MKKKLNLLLVVAMVLSVIMAGCGNSDSSGGSSYPERAIEMVVPFNAGGGSDIMARTIQRIITEEGITDATINVVNKPGGSSSVGYSYMAQQEGNPHFLATTSVSYFTAPILGESPVTYEDFTHIANLATDSILLWVRSDSDVTIFEDVISELKEEPGKYTMAGTSGTSDGFLMYHQVKTKGEVDIDYVPFQSGGEVMTALLGGHIDFAWMNPGETVAQFEAGEIRPLVTASEERLPAYADVPTLMESGIDASFQQYRGLILPKGVDQEVIEYWQNVARKLVETEAWQEGYIKANSLTPLYLEGQDFRDAAEELSNTYTEIFKEMELID